MVEVCSGYNPRIFKRMNKELKVCGLYGTIVWDKADRIFYLYVSPKQYRLACALLFQ